LLTSGGVNERRCVSTKLGLKGDPAIAESVTIARDIEIASYLNARVHICHVSIKRGCELIRAAKAQGIKVTRRGMPASFCLTDEACLNI